MKKIHATKKSYKITHSVFRKKHFIYSLTLVSVLGILILGGSIRLFKNTSKLEKSESYKYFTTVCIQQGECLWSLSDQYMSSEYSNKEDYIKEVKELNHLTSDQINAGDYLMLPYYSSEIL